MATVNLYATGDQIAFYNSFSVSGKGNGTKILLKDSTPLGTSTEYFRIEITNVAPSDTAIGGTQIIKVYAYPPTSSPEEPLFTEMKAITTDFDGRATSANHIILDGPGSTGLVITTYPLAPGTIQIDPGNAPVRYEPFPFTNLTSTPPTFPCFAKGTLIETDIGPLPIESLRAGDMVATLDNGLQRLRWIGRRTVPGTGALAPITIEAGALGNFRRLVVSPQHRMLVRDWRNDLYFGQSQVLVAAVHLVNGTTIRQTPVPKVTYVHVMFDSHEILFAEGIPSESLYLGDEATGALGAEAINEINAVFPELEESRPVTARHCLKAYESSLINHSRKRGRRSSAA